MVCPQTNNTPHEYKVASSLKNGINNTRKVTINETKILKIKRSNKDSIYNRLLLNIL